MHIILMILGAAAAIGTIVWRIQMAAHAAREVGEFAKTAANLPRRLAFRRKTGKTGSDLIEDPREAAVVLMLEVARAGGDVSREQKSVICEQITRHFGFSDADAEELVVQAGWVSQPEAGTDALLRRMSRLIAKSVTSEELSELDAMLTAVSEAEGGPSAYQEEILESFRRLTTP